MGCHQSSNTLNENILHQMLGWTQNEEFTKKASQAYKLSSSKQIDLITSFLKKNEQFYVNVLDIIQTNGETKNMKLKIQPLLKTVVTANPNSDFYSATSVIIGAFLGDAMGSFCEFSKRDSLNYEKIWQERNVFNLSKGHLTDDSEMALSLCYAIMDGKSLNTLSQHLIYYYYGLWFLSSPPDIGTTTKSSLAAIDYDTNDFTIANEKLFNNAKIKIKSRKEDENLSNGFLMRISPLAVWFYYKEKKLITSTFKSNRTVEDFKLLYGKILSETEKDTLITHIECKEATTAGALYIFLILNCMVNDTPENILENISILLEKFICESNYDGEREAGRQFSNTVNRVKCNKDICADKYYELARVDNNTMGFYMHAIRFTFFYLRHFDEIKSTVGLEKIYRHVMNEICNLGGDTDTNCCIVGAVLGPLIGVSNFGPELSDLINCVDQNRPLYSAAICIHFVKFLEETFSSDET